jgi:hypothetical protein
MIKSKSGQIWVETVIYTLIAFVLISAVLAIAQPKIKEIQDKTYLEQSIGIMKDINNIFLSLAQGGIGNKRLIEIGINKGELKIDGEKDMLIFEMESNYLYSEPNQNVFNGDIQIYTREKGDGFVINMTQNYSGSYNITYIGVDESKIISSSSAPYRIFISNKGKDSLDRIIINFENG